MSDANDDLLARGRAIFERLRMEPPSDAVDPGAEVDRGLDDSASPPGQEPAPEPARDPVVGEIGAPDAPDVTAPTSEPDESQGGPRADDVPAGPPAVVAAVDDPWSPRNEMVEESQREVPPTEPAPEALGAVGAALSAPSDAPTSANGQMASDEHGEVGLGATITEPLAPVIDPAPTIDPAPAPTPAAEPAADPPVTPPAPAPQSEAPPTSPPSKFARPLPRVIAVANQKGGVGKTTTAINLGACLADLDYRVLVIDLDPQGNATTGLGINVRNLQQSTYDVVMHDLPLEDCIEATSVRNLFIAPANLDLAGAEIELVPAFSRELKLRRALEEVLDDYDFVFIDCPPSLGLLTVNGLAAATEVLVPIQCEYYALEGLGQLLRNVNLVQKNLNPRLEVSTIILVMYDARTKLADQVVKEVRSHFGEKVCRNVVPRTVRLSEAPSFGQPIIAFDPSSRGAIAYRELAKEVSGGTPQRTR